jgi:hypothetical protein
VRIADNYEIAVMVANNSPQLLLLPELVFVVAVKAAGSSTVSAANVLDVNMSLVVEEMAANNWSTTAAMAGSTGYFVAMARKKEIALVVSAGKKFGFAEVTIVNNSDRVAQESDMKLKVAVMAVNSW